MLTARRPGSVLVLITVLSAALLFAAAAWSSVIPQSPIGKRPPVVQRPLVPVNTAPPSKPVRLVFIHHSTGTGWLSDSHGRLGRALAANNYFVSDTNYGWGPDGIGNRTDIGNWWQWFRGPSSAIYTSALYKESGQHCSYPRLAEKPGGPNRVIVFMSGFRNSALKGDPTVAVPTIDRDPLQGQSCDSEYHTVANAKGIYIDLLRYFAAHQEKLFIVVTAPPLGDETYALNARVFNDWLTTSWLRNYHYKNVFVFDFYNVLTSNGGDPKISDVGQATGNHHRVWLGAIQHQVDTGNVFAGNVLAYPTNTNHPTGVGVRKATVEFLPLLNYAYDSWRASKN